MTETAESRVAIEAVRLAAELCRRVQAEHLAAQTVEKSDRSPVTVADFGSQALVCARLAEAFPGDRVVAEESTEELARPEGAALLERVVARVGDALQRPVDAGEVLEWIERGGGEPSRERRFWTLDPIDGTRGFLRGAQYAVALALIGNGEVELGALACPNLEDGAGGIGVLLLARRGEGCFALPLDGGGAPRPLSVPAGARAVPRRLVESVEPGHSDHALAERIARRVGLESESLRVDSQAKYAVVARGGACVYLRLPRDPGYLERIWDHAAGKLVVEEAGGRVTDLDGRPLDFGQGRRLAANRGIVATGGIDHDAILDAVRRECA